MPLFYFHLRTPDGLDRDMDGLDYPDLTAAYREACNSIPGLSAELLRERRDPMACAFVIADGDGATLIEVPFDETVRHRRRRGSAASQVVTTIEQTQNLAAAVYELNVEALRNVARLRELLGGRARSGH